MAIGCCIVVICFQLLVLRSLNTTCRICTNITWRLWFAFNYWYYDLWIQRHYFRLVNDISCDLLSITGITIFEYNIKQGRYWKTVVVICFQLLVLRSLNTTGGCNIGRMHAVVICFQLLVLRSLNTTSRYSWRWIRQLWFAFNYWYYDLWIQRDSNNKTI